ncbi:small secreted protein [Mycena floridula]|nr:small secreted protein [Mycena floridula]
MPVPWQAVLPMGLMTVFFGVTGTLLNITMRAENHGKNPRYMVDSWDEMMMQRDRELTGHARIQSTEIAAPPGYKPTDVFKSK